jgi:hypothetical protein
MSLRSSCDKATLFEGAHIPSIIFSAHFVHASLVVISAVRSHNVLRVSKSYESYGDKFTTTTIEDLATSDLSQAVKGSS